MNNVKMSKADFVKEHKHLVKVLKTGSKKMRIKEANDQASELKRVQRRSKAGVVRKKH